jgi:hypothetical protein
VLEQRIEGQKGFNHGTSSQQQIATRVLTTKGSRRGRQNSKGLCAAVTDASAKTSPRANRRCFGKDETAIATTATLREAVVVAGASTLARGTVTTNRPSRRARKR